MLITIKNMWANQVLFHRRYLARHFAAIHEIKPVLELDKPVYLGLSILDLRKFLMYEFHYKYIERKYDNSAKLLFTETDSLVYDIKTDGVNKDFYKDKNVFDFSDYPEDFKFFNPVNKKVIFKMKDRKMKWNHRENNQWICWIKVKDVFLNCCRWWRNSKSERVNKNVVKNIRHKEFVDVLFNKKMIRHKMERIQSKLNSIEAYDTFKFFWSCFDDKRYGINSLAYFHKNVK